MTAPARIGPSCKEAGWTLRLLAGLGLAILTIALASTELSASGPLRTASRSLDAIAEATCRGARTDAPGEGRLDESTPAVAARALVRRSSGRDAHPRDRWTPFDGLAAAPDVASEGPLGVAATGCSGAPARRRGSAPSIHIERGVHGPRAPPSTAV